MNVVLFFLIVVALLESFNRVCAALGLSPGVERFLGSSALLWIWLILAAWGLSLIHLLTEEALGVVIIITLVSVAIALPKPDRLLLQQGRDFLEAAWSFVRGHRVHGVLVVLVAVWILWSIVRALIAAPVTFDSMTYHLPMVASWLQRGGLGYYETTTLRQVTSPVNVEIVQMFHIIFLRRDTIVDLVQLEFLILSLLGVYHIARKAGLPQTWGVSGATIFLTVPLILMHSYTTQNDLGVVAGMVLSLAMLASYIDDRRVEKLILLGMLLGLLVGIKLHMLIALPVFLLITVVVVVLLHRHESPHKRALLFLGVALLSVFLLGGEVYFSNVVRYKTLFPLIGSMEANFVIGVPTLLENIFYFAKWWFIDCWDYVSPVTWNQDTGHYGPFFGYVILPLGLLGTVVAAVRLFRKDSEPRGNLAIFSAGFVAVAIFIGFCLSHRPRPYDLRYLQFIPMLMGVIAVWTVRWVSEKLDTAFAGALVLVALPTVFATAWYHRYPDVRELYTLEPWQRSSVYLPEYGQDAGLYKEFEQNAHPGETVLFCGMEDDWSYPLFGEDFSRRVYFPTSFDRFVVYLAQYPVDWVFIRERFENQDIVDLVKSQPSRFVPVASSPDTTGHYYGAAMLLYKVRRPFKNPTWQRGIYDDKVSSGDIVLGSSLPGKFIFHCIVDTRWEDKLTMTVQAPDELPTIIPLSPAGPVTVELLLKKPGELSCHLSQTYVPNEFGINEDTRQLGVLVPSVEFMYVPDSALSTVVQVFP
jgi:hypothetical protein